MKKLKFIFSIFLISISFSFYIFNSHYFNKTDCNKIVIHYIDVGQGDCILVQVNDKNLLIDSGPSSNRKNLLNYFDELKIKNFDYIIATHPHEDHIGNMDTIIRRFSIGNFYAPKVTTTSTSFENMVSALVDKNLKINVLKENTSTINLGKNTSVQVFSPIENMVSDNLNDYSPIIKIQFLNTSFLFTGDAEVLTEQQVLSNYKNDLHCNIIKIGHHGSSSSTSSDFLSAVDPSIAIISVGKNNSYDHPSSTTLNLLNSNKIYTLRTDINGTIVVTSDGTNINISLK